MLTKQVQLLRERLKATSLGNTVAAFLDYLTVEAGLSENTLLAYGRDLLAFSEFCQTQSVKRLNDIIPVTVYHYMRHLSKLGRAENSISRSLVAIKMLLRFGTLTGQVSEDITDSLEGPKLWKKLPAVASKDQVFRLMASPVPEDPYYLRDKALLHVLYATGARASEVVGLKISDVNLNIGYVRWGSTSPSTCTACGTVSPPICCPAAPTCAPSRKCSATRISKPPKSILMSTMND